MNEDNERSERGVAHDEFLAKRKYKQYAFRREIYC